jgi:hypothetical protein
MWECQSRRRNEMIKQRVNQVPCSPRGKFCAKNLLCDREAMSEIKEFFSTTLTMKASHVSSPCIEAAPCALPG